MLFLFVLTPGCAAGFLVDWRGECVIDAMTTTRFLRVDGQRGRRISRTLPREKAFLSHRIKVWWLDGSLPNHSRNLSVTFSPLYFRTWIHTTVSNCSSKVNSLVSVIVLQQIRKRETLYWSTHITYSTLREVTWQLCDNHIGVRIRNTVAMLGSRWEVQILSILPT